MKRTAKAPRGSKNSLGSVDEIMSNEVITIEPQVAASVARSRMRRRNASHLVVTEGGRLRGILSERDLEGAKGRSGRSGRMVEDLMTSRVVSAVPDTSLERAASLMGRQRIGCLPVLDGDQVVGIVTATTVFDELERRSARAPFPGWLPRPAKVESSRATAAEIPAHIRVSGAKTSKKERDQLRERLGAKLGKFEDSIERITVRLKDENGPRGGIDQVCQIKVVLIGLPSVVFEARDASLDRAITKAVLGIYRSVRQSVQRRRMAPIKVRARSRSAAEGATE